MADNTRFQEEMAAQWQNSYQSLNEETETALNAVKATLDALSGSTTEDDILQTITQVATDVMDAFIELINAFTNLLNAVANVISQYRGLVEEAVEVVKTVLPLL